VHVRQWSGLGGRQCKRQRIRDLRSEVEGVNWLVSRCGMMYVDAVRKEGAARAFLAEV
jgi:hypothetical protein